MTKPKPTTNVKVLELARQLNRDFEEIVPWRRNGTVIHVHTDETMPNPPAAAWYDPKTFDISVHLDKAGLNTLLKRDFSIYDTDKTNAKVMGLLIHEAAHSKRSHWLDSHLKRRHELMPIITLFEEIRIERWAVDTKVSHVRKCLRASFDIILGDHKPEILDRWSAAFNWALLYGRVFAGVADESEVTALDIASRTLLGDELVDQMTEILQEATVVDNTTPQRIVELAEEWTELVGMPPEVLVICAADADGTPADMEIPGEGEGEPGEDDRDPDKEHKIDFGEVDSLDSDGEIEDADPGDDWTPQDLKILDEAVEDVLEDITKAFDADGKGNLGNAEEFAKRVFGKRQELSSNRSRKVSAPSAKIRQSVTRVARALETMQLPTIAKAPMMNELPPGRLRTRAALQASADRAAGRMTDARPWKGTKRQHTNVKPIIVGVMTDTSGSMGWAEQAVANYAYVLSNAGSRVGARTAAVTFGNSASAVSWPGSPAPTVNVRKADGSMEAFDDAIAALDGVLKLTHLNNASKLLLVVSDGHLVRTGETAKAKLWMERMHRAGVRVVWITNVNEAGIKKMAPQAEVVTVVMKHYSEDGDVVSERMLDATVKTLEKMS